MSVFKFGCILFDLIEISQGEFGPMPGSGWASVDGYVAFRFNNIKDLSENVKWWTNLSQETLWKSGAVLQGKLKHSGYLRTDMAFILKEMGLQKHSIPIAESCQILSELFSKTMKLAIEFYGLKVFNQKELHAELKLVLVGEDKNISSYVDEALVRAYQDLVICEKNPNKGNYFITMKRPRYFHAKTILEAAIPHHDGDWDFIGPDDLPNNEEDKFDYLMKQARPFVAKININLIHFKTKADLDIAKLLDLGEAIGEGGRPRERNWVSQPELLYLRKFADITISAAFMATKYKNLDKGAMLPYLGELSDFSYSLGLLAESVWFALATRSINPKTRSKTLVSPRACWLKASDRFLTLTSAMILNAAGFTIVSYGYGSVTLNVSELQIPKLMEFAPHAGLSVPLNLIEKNYM